MKSFEASNDLTHLSMLHVIALPITIVNEQLGNDRHTHDVILRGQVTSRLNIRLKSHVLHQYL